LTASDSLGNSAAPVSIAVTVNGLPVIGAPASATVSQGSATAISGLSLTDTNGLLSATGLGIAGSGTTTLTISWSLAQVNSDLATVTDTDSSSAPDTIHLTASDSLGNSAAPASIAVTVSAS